MCQAAIIGALRLWCLGPLNGTNERSPPPQIRAGQSVSPSRVKSDGSVSTSLCPQNGTVVIPASEAKKRKRGNLHKVTKHSGACHLSISFTASILVLKLIIERSVLIVLETPQLAFPGEFHPTPSMQVSVISPQTWSGEALFPSGDNQGRKTNVNSRESHQLLC